jgi:hypothetical protein
MGTVRIVDLTPDTSGVLAGPPGGASGSGPVAEPTIDEFYQRYRPVRTGMLRNMLAGADVDGIGKTASAWYNTSNVLFTIADAMSKGLLGLRESWTGDAADAHERRMFALVARVQSLADEAAAMQTGLSMMSASAGIAKNRAAGAPVVASPFARVGVVDADLGYQQGQPPEMARVVADLALDYALIEQKVWFGPLPQHSPEPPPVEPDPPQHTEMAGVPDSLGATAITPPGAVSAPMVGAVPGVITAQADHIASPIGGASGAATASTGMGPGMMGMMGGAHPGGSADAARNSDKFWRGDEMAWSRNEHADWVGPDEQPPPVIDRRA